MSPIRRAWRAMWFKDDDDNTPQGKLARGTFRLLGGIVLFSAFVVTVHDLFQYLGWKP